MKGVDFMDKLNNESNTNIEEILENYRKDPSPKVSELNTMIIIFVTCIIGAIIGMELIVNLGISANTSVIGALIAVLLSMIPIKFFKNLKNVFRQNLIQTSISAATFTAGNVFMVSLGAIWIYGDMSLINPMIIGCTIGLLIDIFLMYRLFDTPVFPAKGTWPAGVATAETIISVVGGGKRAILLVATSIVGAIGQFLGIPMDICGVCWIGNVWALIMFGVGLIISGNSTNFFGFAIGDLYIPHGMMIGAGIVALVQLVRTLLSKNNKLISEVNIDNTDGNVNSDTTIKDSNHSIKSIGTGFLLYIILSIIIALLAGLFSKMSTSMFIVWVLFTSVTTIISELIVGTAAMHAGWFPAMAISLMFLIIGMVFKFPPKALLMFVGFKTATGPAFADMGYDLKTGWILRGHGNDPAYEISGQREQFIGEVLGAIIGSVVAILSFKRYFMNGQIPPFSSVFVATINAGTSPEVLRILIIFGIIGGIIQAIGGTEKQIGVMFATGLLIGNTIGGIFALVAIAIRVFLEKKYGEQVSSIIAVSAAGFIVGSSLYNFSSGIFKTIKKKGV
jgi:uncharacterized oligopeptide transporter (OPT) family protein